MKKKLTLGSALRFLFLGFFVAISVGPLLWVIMSSFKSNKEILASAFALPTSWAPVGYKAALEMAPIGTFYKNSVIISVVSTLLNVLVVSMAAYVLARHKFRGNTFIVNGKTSILYWRRQWHPTPVLLLGKPHGQRSLVGCSPCGR